MARSGLYEKPITCPLIVDQCQALEGFSPVTERQRQGRSQPQGLFLLSGCVRARSGWRQWQVLKKTWLKINECGQNLALEMLVGVFTFHGSSGSSSPRVAESRAWRRQNRVTWNLFQVAQWLVAFSDWFIPFPSAFSRQSKTLGLHYCNYFLSATVSQGRKTWSVVKLENSTL